MPNSRKTFYDNRKNEKYYKLAKKTNVRARSYFKLEQIDSSYNIIKNDLNIIDLGAAPGGWLEYIDKKIKSGNVIGIDLLEIKDQKDFSSKVKIIHDNFNNILDYVDDKFDLILSDMAPEFSGDSKFDRGRTHKLNLEVIKFSDEYLKIGGNLVFKTFEGEDLNYVKRELKNKFKKVINFKPKSSDTKSAEFFVVCLQKN